MVPPWAVFLVSCTSELRCGVLKVVVHSINVNVTLQNQITFVPLWAQGDTEVIITMISVWFWFFFQCQQIVLAKARTGQARNSGGWLSMFLRTSVFAETNPLQNIASLVGCMMMLNASRSPHTLVWYLWQLFKVWVSLLQCGFSNSKHEIWAPLLLNPRRVSVCFRVGSYGCRMHTFAFGLLF